MGLISFTVGIPIWNEQAILEQNVRRLCEHLDRFRDYEILIVSNGSTDRSDEIGKRLARENSRIRFFVLAEKDVAGAFKMMLQEARFDFLVSMDIDLSADLAFLDRVRELAPSHDLVVGSKVLGSQNRSWIRRFGSSVYVRCAQWLLQLDVEDFSMGAKGYRTSFFRKHTPKIGKGTAYVLDCVYIARWNGGRIAEVPISCHDFRESRFNLAYEAYHKYTRLLGLWRHHTPANR